MLDFNPSMDHQTQLVRDASEIRNDTPSSFDFVASPSYKQKANLVT